MLFGERVDPYESLNSIIPNCQSSCIISRLCMWSCDLRHQRHLVVDDHVLIIPSHGISKTSHIRDDMKSLKIIVWSRWDRSPSIFEEIDSRNEI